MTTSFAIQIMLYTAAIILITFGILHEDRLIAFERRIIILIGKLVHIHRCRKAESEKRAVRAKFHIVRGSNDSGCTPDRAA